MVKTNAKYLFDTIGIANNKTLSKIANHLAKKDELGTQVVELLDRRQIEIALKVLEVGDIWGIGSRISKFLQSNSIKTAYDLYSSDIELALDNLINRLVFKKLLLDKEDQEMINELFSNKFATLVAFKPTTPK